MKNPISIKNFIQDGDAEVSTGFWKCNIFGELCYNVNYSWILTKLIQEAGKCVAFASDLFIQWEGLLDKMEKEGIDFSGGKYLFGFREYGVDSDSHIFDVFDPCGFITRHPEKHYNSIYALEIVVEHGYKMEMKLYKVRFIEK